LRSNADRKAAKKEFLPEKRLSYLSLWNLLNARRESGALTLVCSAWYLVRTTKKGLSCSASGISWGLGKTRDFPSVALFCVAGFLFLMRYL
jgi:hypothetical protein